MAPQRLCTHCCNLSFSSLFFGPFDANKTVTYEYERQFQEVWAEQECPFCCFLRRVLCAYYGEAYVEDYVRKGTLRNVVIYRRSLDPSHGSVNFTASKSVACCLDIGDTIPLHLLDEETTSEFVRQSRHALGERNRDWVMPSLFLVGSADTSNCPGRFVDAAAIDWTLVKDWISACDTHWSNPQEPPLADEDYRSTLLVIDVDRGCIIDCPSHAPYLALSYQWGTDQKLKLRKCNRHLLKTPGFFWSSDGAPSQTIVDSIAVAQNLGHRYLWIDALCIVQDDPANVIENVGMMDQVYLGAELTIVAAAGINAYHGLPGVSATPRSEVQLLLEVDGLIIASMLEQPQNAIDFSRWNTRGWTYQERILSKRLLYFTESQMSYYCDSGCLFQEQCHFDAQKDVRTNRYTLWDFRARFDFASTNLWNMYASAVAEYTRRSITDPSDKLNAMRGILNYLKVPFACPFAYGLPVHLFDVALLWKPLEHYSRGNQSLPSWSWVGWNAGIAYEPEDSMANMCMCTINQADIWTIEQPVQLASAVQDAETPWANVDPQMWRKNMDEVTLEIEFEKSGSNSTFNGQKIRYPRPFGGVGLLDKEKLLWYCSRKLRIHAKVASFWLTNQHSLLSDVMVRNKPACNGDTHQLCYLAVLDDDRHIAGTIIVDGQLAPKLANRQHRFVGLSRSTLYRIDEDPSWDEETQTFRHWSKQGPLGTEPKEGIDEKQFAQRFADAVLPESTLEANVDFFDRRYYSGEVFWPAINVLLLSEADEGGVVERLGVGRIHVDAFAPVAKREEIILG